MGRGRHGHGEIEKICQHLLFCRCGGHHPRVTLVEGYPPALFEIVEVKDWDLGI